MLTKDFATNECGVVMSSVVSVCVSFRALTFETLDLWTSFSVCSFRTCRSRSNIKVKVTRA